MSHHESRMFFESIKQKYPNYFKDKKILDIGSLDINGNLSYLFENSEYIGLDVAEGKNVNVVSLAHEYGKEDAFFDVIVSSDCFEHDMYYEKTFNNVIRLLKPKGIFIFSCKTIGAGEHGTLRTDGGMSSPLTSKIKGWENYYKNLSEQDIRAILNIEEIFSEFKFDILDRPRDLRFYGIKK